MLSIPPTTRVYAYIKPADMRKSFSGLVGIVEQELGQQVVIRRFNSSHLSAGSFRPGVWVNDRCGRYDWQVSTAAASVVLGFFFVPEPAGAMAGVGA